MENGNTDPDERQDGVHDFNLRVLSQRDTSCIRVQDGNAEVEQWDYGVVPVCCRCHDLWFGVN